MSNHSLVVDGSGNGGGPPPGHPTAPCSRTNTEGENRVMAYKSVPNGSRWAAPLGQPTQAVPQRSQPPEWDGPAPEVGSFSHYLRCIRSRDNATLKSVYGSEWNRTKGFSVQKAGALSETVGGLAG